MSEGTDSRVSDADRERTVEALREHAAQGRLTLEELAERVEAAYVARTQADLAALTSDLPGDAPQPQPQRRPVRRVLSLFGSSEYGGRLLLAPRVRCLTAFGGLDLDLRGATLEGNAVTLEVLSAFGGVDVYVPEGVDVELDGFVVFGHKAARGNEPPPQPERPLVRVVARAAFGGVDVWRTPATWGEVSLRDVRRRIRRGEHRAVTA